MYQARTDIKPYTDNGRVISLGCNVIEFTNDGEVTFLIQDARKVRPGQSIAINQVHPQVADNTTYNIRFLPTDAANTGTQQLCVVTTIYTEVNCS